MLWFVDLFHAKVATMFGSPSLIRDTKVNLGILFDASGSEISEIAIRQKWKFLRNC